MTMARYIIAGILNHAQRKRNKIAMMIIIMKMMTPAMTYDGGDVPVRHGHRGR